MEQKSIEIETGEGMMEAFAARPSSSGPHPVVVIFQDIWGVREELYGIARDVATAGYFCLVPDFYYRLDKVRFGVRDDDGRMVSLHLLPPDTQNEIIATGQRLSNEMVLADLEAIIGHLALSEPVDVSAMGGVGFCMGGRHVFFAAGHYPDNFRAVASLHGTDLVTEGPGCAHLLAARMSGALYCGYGELDRFSPPEVIAAIEAYCAPLAVDYSHSVHLGVDHGYALPDRDIHDAQATATDWAKIMIMFNRHLMAR